MYYLTRIYMQGEIIETMQFMLSPYGRRVSNLEDLASCLDKMTLLAEEDDRIIEAREKAPTSVPQFERLTCWVGVCPPPSSLVRCVVIA